MTEIRYVWVKMSLMTQEVEQILSGNLVYYHELLNIDAF